jgi:hypothetical protein
MRAIDNNRKIAMNSIKVHTRAILIMVDEYEKVYNSKASSNGDKMQNLDEIWRIITVNQTALTEILRENGL